MPLDSPSQGSEETFVVDPATSFTTISLGGRA